MNPETMQSRVEEAYQRLERHLDVHYYPGARDDLRDLRLAAAATPQPAQPDEHMVETIREFGANGDWIAVRINEDGWDVLTAEESGRRLAATPSPVVEKGETYAGFQQRRGRLPDLIEEAIAIYDGYMVDDDYDAQGCLDKVADHLRTARDWYDAAPAAPAAENGADRLKPYDFHPHEGAIPEAKFSIVARAVRASLRSYGHRVAESSLPECIATDVLSALHPDTGAK